MHLIDQLRRDFYYGLRMAARHRGFAATAILTLALGIGATTATFTIVDAIVFKPLPYADPDRLVKIWGQGSAEPSDNMSLPDFTDIRERTALFEQVGADDGTGFKVEDGTSHHAANGALVTSGWLSTFGVRLPLGRAFLLEEFQAGRDDVLILTHVYWQRRFAGDQSVVGRTLRIDGQSCTIVGVLPPNVLRYGADFLKPLVEGAYPPARDYRNLDVVARLRPGVTLAAVQAALDVLGRQVEAANPSPHVNHRFAVMHLDKYYASIDPAAGRSLTLMLGAVGLVLLIACVNVANLLLAHAAARGRECVIRAALGASRARLARQLLIEHLVLFVAGGGLGCFLAWWSLDLIAALGVAGGYVPERMLVALDQRVLGFGLLLTLVTGTVFGLIPAVRGSRVDVNEGLKDSGQADRGGPSGGRTRQLLVVAELTLSVVLLVGCGLIVRSLTSLYANADGFVPDRLLETGSDAGRDYAPALAKWQTALARTRAIPGVEFAALSSRPPVHGGRVQSFTVDRRADGQVGAEGRAGDILISADYFRVMGIPLVKGRAFTEQDTHSSVPVVIVSETLVRQQFPGQDPIGRRIRINERTPMSCCVTAAPVDNVWREIVGVVRDIRQANLDEAPAATMYRPYAQIFEHDMFLMVRTGTDRDMAPVSAALARELRAADPSMDWWDVRPMHQVIAESGAIRARRFVVQLLGAFAALALVLAAVGLYGVMAYFVIERRREIAVRMALGATQPAVITQVLGEAGRLVTMGLVAGAIAAQLFTRLIGSLLFGVTKTDVPTHLAVFALLGTIALVASYLPARRAATIDPMVALRE